MPFLSVIIPVYNEAKRIVPTLFDISQYLSKVGYSYQILVVDDGSTDNTFQIVENLKEKINNLEIIGYGENRGKGGAVISGMLNAKGDNILFMDADNSTQIKEIEKFIPFLNNFDVVIGSRSLSDSKILLKQPFYKEMLGKGGNLLTRILILPKIKDTQCGFKLFTKKSAKDIFKRMRVKGVLFDVEALVIAKLLGYQIKEVGIEWKNDEDSKFKIPSYFRALLDVFVVKWNLINNKYKK
jgi:dolichyl-phosphate beta-glucosyltransferase